MYVLNTCSITSNAMQSQHHLCLLQLKMNSFFPQTQIIIPDLLFFLNRRQLLSTLFHAKINQCMNQLMQSLELIYDCCILTEKRCRLLFFFPFC